LRDEENNLQINSDDSSALYQLVSSRRKNCDWRDFDELALRVRQITEANLKAGQPPVETVLASLSMSMDGAYQYRLAKAWADNRGKNYLLRFSHDRITTSENAARRITVGYISDEFRDHPIGHLMRDYFKYHDRDQFRVIVYFDHKPDERDAVYQVIKAGCEVSRNVSDMDHHALADLIHKDGVDILVDLKGWREHNRLAVFAQRPSPISVAFQGFPGTTGAEYLDYLIVDDYVVPEEEGGNYAEKLAYLGRCYQVNSSSRPTLDELRPLAGARHDHGLPDDAVVLASFNQAYKLDPHMMTVWLDILRAAENSVLWLLELTEACRENLGQFASQQGIAPQRLIFAPWADQEHHLARLTHADIGVDTRIYNGHATTSDCLWCRVPVVTLRGQHFASRVSASILREVGLPELVTNDLHEYRELSLRLIDDVPLRQAMRDRLTTEQLRSTLFNTPDYVRRLEDLFQQMVGRYRGQLEPQLLRCRL
jgi:protein O-GlcNAc transferase